MDDSVDSQAGEKADTQRDGQDDRALRSLRAVQCGRRGLPQLLNVGLFATTGSASVQSYEFHCDGIVTRTQNM